MKAIFLALFLQIIVTETQLTCRLSKQGHVERFDGLKLRRKLCKPTLVVGECSGNWSITLNSDNKFYIYNGNETIAEVPDSTMKTSEFTVAVNKKGSAVSVSVPKVEDLCGNCVDEEQGECKPVDVIGSFFL